MFQITKPEVSPLVTLDDTDDYTAALTVHQHREKLTALLTPEQLEQLASEAHNLAQQLVTERDADAADAERPRMTHAFDVDTAAEHQTEADWAQANPSMGYSQLDDAHAATNSVDAVTRYAWIVRPDRAGIGLWDRQDNLIAWWNHYLDEVNRAWAMSVVDNDKDLLVWVPADAYKPFTIAVLS